MRTGEVHDLIYQNPKRDDSVFWMAVLLVVSQGLKLFLPMFIASSVTFILACLEACAVILVFLMHLPKEQDALTYVVPFFCIAAV